MATSLAPLPVEAFAALVGTEVGVSRWLPVEQSRIDGFAHATGDFQFLHVDPARAAAEGPFGGTIAHGFLTLALLSAFFWEAVPPIAGATSGVNYGLDAVRFLAPVPSGARVRARFTLAKVEQRGESALLLTWSVAVEIDGATRPALVAQWLTLHRLGASTIGRG